MDNNETTIKVVGIRFKDVGKIYHFLPQDDTYTAGEKVIVETERGTECGEVVKGDLTINKEQAVEPMKKIIRKLTDEDVAALEENKTREKEALRICSEYISELKLDMKLVEVELTFDRNKMVFYFTSEGRVDFRELVKKLALVYRTRIELRQIGVRDEAKMLNGIGMCGRPLCCSTFLGDFHPVSIKMAKEQNLSLNPTKISGICGRLMCCLKYEEEVYHELGKNLPGQGDIVKTPKGEGEVLSTHLLMQQVKVILKLKENEPPTIEFYPVSEVELVRTKKKHRQQLMQKEAQEKEGKTGKHERHEKHEKHEKSSNNPKQQNQVKNDKPRNQQNQQNQQKQGNQGNQGNQGKNQSHKQNNNKQNHNKQNNNKQNHKPNHKPNVNHNKKADGARKNEE